MGVPGIKWDPEDQRIVDAIRKSKGNLTIAATYLGCCRYSLRKLINTKPDIDEILKEVRQYGLQEMIETAENTVSYGMTKAEKDLPSALKAAFFVLNSRGKEWGWNPTHVTQNNPIRIEMVNYADPVIKSTTEPNSESKEEPESIQ